MSERNERVVMVVDDDDALRESVCELLEDDGYTAVGADGGSSALELLKSDQHKPDLILLDLMMPGMTGWDFRAAQLSDRSLAPIPTVVMTASREVKGINVNDVVYKPITREKLLTVVHRNTERAEPFGSKAPTVSEPPRRRETDRAGREVAPKRELDEAVAQRERRYSMFMQVPVPICVFRGHDLVYEMANPLYDEVAGRALVGQRLPDIAPGAQGQRIAARLRAVLATDAPITGKEELVRIAGEDRYFTYIFAPIHNLEGVADRVMVVAHEVTEQVLARRRVEESESLFRELVGQVKDYAIFRMDSQGHPVTWNEGVKRVLGFDEADFIGKDVRAIFTPEDVQARVPEEELEAAVREGTANNDRWMRRKNGERFAAAGATAALRGPAGELLGFTKVLRDQTEKVLAQEELARLAAIVTSTDDAVISTDLQGIVLSWNKGAEQLYGFLADEVIGRPLPTLSPEDRANERPRILERIMRGETVSSLETVRRKKDGTLLDVSLTVSPVLDPHGHVVGVAKIARDITFRKHLDQTVRRSEARFRAIFEGTAVSIWEEDYGDVRRFAERLKAEHGAQLREFLHGHPEVVDEAIALMRVRDVNPATLRLFDASSKQELAQGLPTLFLPETRSSFIDAFIKLADGVRHFSTETVLQTLTGRRIEVALTMSFPSSDDAAERVLVTITDISAQKFAEGLREARVAEMERAVRFSEMFIGILGHDLRNPLNAITMAASLISRAEPNAAKPATRILTSAGRMERMIAQLLDFTRVRLGRGIPLDRTSVDLSEVCRVTIGELETATDCEVRLEQEGDTNGNWDRDRLAQLVSNLVANACHHGKQGSPVMVRLDGTAAERVRLEVRNQGTIPSELMPVLFEPMRSKTAGQRTRKQAGLGLGLYITQQIVLAHGGEIRVESDETQGTRFFITLPRLPPAEADRVFGAAPTRGDPE